MSDTERANAINEVSHRMGVICLGISIVFVAAIYFSRVARQRRFLLRLYVAILSAVCLWFVAPFLRAGYDAIDTAFMLGATALIFGLYLRFNTFCDSCNRAVGNNHPWTRIRNCPHCGAQLSRPL